MTKIIDANGFRKDVPFQLVDLLLEHNQERMIHHVSSPKERN